MFLYAQEDVCLRCSSAGSSYLTLQVIRGKNAARLALCHRCGRVIMWSFFSRRAMPPGCHLSRSLCWYCNGERLQTNWWRSDLIRWRRFTALCRGCIRHSSLCSKHSSCDKMIQELGQLPFQSLKGRAELLFRGTRSVADVTDFTNYIHLFFSRC